MEDKDVIKTILEYLKDNESIDINTAIAINNLNNTDNNRRKLSGIFKKIDLEYEYIELKKIKSKYYLINNKHRIERNKSLIDILLNNKEINVKYLDNVEFCKVKLIDNRLKVVDNDYNNIEYFKTINNIDIYGRYVRGVLKSIIVVKDNNVINELYIKRDIVIIDIE